MSDFLRIQIEEAEKDLAVVLEQYVAVSEQLRETIESGLKPKLEAQRERFNREARTIEARLTDLMRRRGLVAPSKGESVAAPSPRLAELGGTWGVLVGVNRYDNYAELQVCAKDVDAITAKLSENNSSGDHIRALTDNKPDQPTRKNIWVALNSAVEKAKRNDLLLFYFSGHGDTDNGKSYLLAQDSQPKSTTKSLALADIRDLMRKGRTSKKVIILDACHSGADIGVKGTITATTPTALDRRAMTAEFINQVYDRAEGTAVMASCKQGELSYEWRERERSVFTHFLLEALSGEADFYGKGFVSVHDAHLYVLDRVKAWAAKHDKRQTPTLSAELAGDIILTDFRV